MDKFWILKITGRLVFAPKQKDKIIFTEFGNWNRKLFGFYWWTL